MSDPQSPPKVVDYANANARDEQPLDSRTVLEEHEDGVSFTFLPDGLGSAAVALSLIGLLAAMSVIGVVIALADSVLGDGDSLLAAAMLAMVAAPFALLWEATHRGATRPTVLSVRGGRVTLFSAAALFRPVKSWAAADVVSVGVATSGVSIKMRPTADLSLRMRRRGTVRLICGRDRADLEWVATGLRGALGKREWAA